MTDSDADASLHPLPDEKSDALPLFCKWLYHFLNRTASSEPPVALPALYECAPTPASLPP